MCPVRSSVRERSKEHTARSGSGATITQPRPQRGSTLLRPPVIARCSDRRWFHTAPTAGGSTLLLPPVVPRCSYRRWFHAGARRTRGGAGNCRERGRLGGGARSLPCHSERAKPFLSFRASEASRGIAPLSFPVNGVEATAGDSTCAFVGTRTSTSVLAPLGMTHADSVDDGCSLAADRSPLGSPDGSRLTTRWQFSAPPRILRVSAWNHVARGAWPKALRVSAWNHVARGACP
jgi:hypothetical protein